MGKIRESIVTAIFEKGEDGLTSTELSELLKLDKSEQKKLDKSLAKLVGQGMLKKTGKKKYYLINRAQYFIGEISGVSARFGFVMRGEEELFVPGHDLNGAVLGDIVMARVVAQSDENNRSAVAKVLHLVSKTDKKMTGVIVREGQKLMVKSDSMTDEPLVIAKTGKKLFGEGDKVLFSVFLRGERHAEHSVKIIDVFGNSDAAKSCVNAYLAQNDITVDFSDEAINEALAIEKKGISASDKDKRLDLRDEVIFTIDGADTKDIDDAISIEKTDNGYRLGVHIADVSHYVRMGTPLEEEAFSRGTSIYIADRVVPMLPPALSNGICSLNPKVDRLAFSCRMTFDMHGKMLDYAFDKTLIRSRVKGVYDEINKLLKGSQDKRLLKKYEDVLDKLPIMQALAEIFNKNRVERGSPNIESAESKIYTDSEGKCVDIKPRKSGVSENIIEEFMLMANNAAARLAMDIDVPFVYRVHDKPPAEKLFALAQTLVLLGVDSKSIGESTTAKDMADILIAAKDDDKFPIINRLVLRSMAKAKYSEIPIGHFGLVMKEYTHFTSPIRRYSDLAIHRILTDIISKKPYEKIVKKYADYAKDAAHRATITELLAVKCERECESFYMAEYMKNHIGEVFDGIISGVSPNGFFVALENTIEGMVGINALPSGTYDAIEGIIFKNITDNTEYTVGDKIKVKCISADVNSGQVDFQLEAYEPLQDQRNEKAQVRRSSPSSASHAKSASKPSRRGKSFSREKNAHSKTAPSRRSKTGQTARQKSRPQGKRSKPRDFQG